MKKIILTQREWYDAMKVPTPHRNKKKYTRKSKHKGGGNDPLLYIYNKTENNIK
jgi:hypothetical protein